MIGLDTNVLVRFLVRDDEQQYLQVVAAMERSLAQGEQFFVCEVVLAELVWVLGSRYRCSRPELVAVLRRLIEVQEFTFESTARVVQALGAFERGKGGFSDYLIGARALDAGCSSTLTFDKALHASGVGSDLGFTPVR